MTVTRRSCAEEQYPTFVRNDHLGASKLQLLRRGASALAQGGPLFTVLVAFPDQGDDQRVRALELTLDSAVAQFYPNWELIAAAEETSPSQTRDLLARYERLDSRVSAVHPRRDPDGDLDEKEILSEARLLNVALSSVGGEFVWFVGEGDELSPVALFEVARAISKHPEADLLYTDEDTIDERGNRHSPRFKPGWSPDLLLATNYIGRSGIIRRRVVEELGGMREGFGGAEVHDLLLRLTERTDRVRHLPRVLFHRGDGANGTEGPLREGRIREGTREALSEAMGRRGLGGSVEDGLLPGTFRVRPQIRGEPLVSIIVPSRDNVSMLRSCVKSIESLTEYPNYEILIVDNDSSEPATLEYLANTSHQVIPFRDEFNYSRINNTAVSRARGEYVLLLNDDTEVMEGGWLEAMLEHAQRPEVGAVGAKLLYPDGRVQHAGVVTGVGGLGPGISAHAYQFFGTEDAGHLGTLSTPTNYSAVTAACVLLPKAVYEEAGGLDEENLPVSFNDVDLCLRIRERGYLVVYTPHACLYHHESVSRGRKDDPAESLHMMQRWEGRLDEDPYYNPHFSRGGGDFNIRADLLRPRFLGLRRSPDGLLPTSLEEREQFKKILQGVLTASLDARRDLMEVHQRAARDSYRTTLVPAHKNQSARLDALEGSKDHEESAP